MIRNKGRRTYPRGTVMRFLIETIVSDTGLADLMVGRNEPEGAHPKCHLALLARLAPSKR